MKEYYEKKVVKARLAKKLVSDGIKKELIDRATSQAWDLRSEDLSLYAEILGDAEFYIKSAEEDLAQGIAAQCYPAETVNENA